MKKLLAVIAHPDDETFGFGGTLAKYAAEGVEIHILCATKGEAGKGGAGVDHPREGELLSAAKILGVKEVEFMGFIDGELCNSVYHAVAQKIEEKIKSFTPDIVVTFDSLGVSGHIDHITVSLATTFVIRRLEKRPRLYYYGEDFDKMAAVKDYFIYVPPGFKRENVDVIVDIAPVWDTKVAAMYEHHTQIEDVKTVLKGDEKFPKEEYFMEVFVSGKAKGRSDLFA